MSRPGRRIFVWAVWCSLATAAVFALWRSGTAPRPSRTAATRAPAEQAGPAGAGAVASGPVAEPAPEPLATSELRFPPGVTVAAPNGVTGAPAPCVWGDQPWSPIVRREWNNGLEWYVHADGTYTTTKMSWRSDLGRSDAVTLCVHPMAGVAPHDNGSGG
jgi:hypothetical protein